MRWNSSQTEARGIYPREDGREARLNVVQGAAPETPVSFVEEPASLTVTGGPYATDIYGVAYKYARFSAAVSGSLPITY